MPMLRRSIQERRHSSLGAMVCLIGGGKSLIVLLTRILGICHMLRRTGGYGNASGTEWMRYIACSRVR